MSAKAWKAASSTAAFWIFSSDREVSICFGCFTARVASHNRPSEAIAKAGVDIAPPSNSGSSAHESSSAGFSFDAISTMDNSIVCNSPVVAASTPSTNGKNALGIKATKPTTLWEKKTKRTATTTFSAAINAVMHSQGAPQTS